MNSKILWSLVVLMGCLGLSIYANRATFKSMVLADGASDSSNRAPASIMQTLKKGALMLQERLADELARSPVNSERRPSSIGHPATPLEALKFGILQGKYAVQMKDNRIEAVTFIDTPNSDSTPSTVSDRFDFLKKYGPLFGVPADCHAKRVNVAIRGERIIETYEIKPSRKVAADEKDANVESGQTIVRFELDDLDRLFSIQTEEKKHLQIF